MAKVTTTSGQTQGESTNLPGAGGFNYTSEQPTGGREYGKELLQWSGRQLRGAGRRLNRLVTRLTTRIPHWRLNDIDTDSLNKRMSKINWNKDYYSAEAIAKSERNPRLQRDIMRVNRIFRDLHTLSESNHHMGEEIRWKLQHKYWTHTTLESQIGNTLSSVLPPANFPFHYVRTQQEMAEGVGNPIATGNRNNPSQKQQENEARRIKVAYGSSRLGTSMSPRQRKNKRGMGL